MEARKKLTSHLGKRALELRELKGKGVKVIGYTPGGFMPEEIVYACGAVPVGLIRGGDPEPVTEVPKSVHSLQTAHASPRPSEGEGSCSMTQDERG